MSILPLKKLGSIGMVTDVAPYNLPENAWTDAYNVRFRNGNVEKMTGWEEVLQAAGGSSTLWFTFYKNEMFFSQQDGLYRFDGATVIKLDISIDEADVDNPVLTTLDLTFSVPTDFTFAIVQDNLYINIRGIEYAPFVYSTSRGRLISLSAIPATGSSAAWSTDWTAALIRGYKQTLMTFNTQEGSLTYPTRYRHSGVIRPNGVAQDWDASDDRGTAGFNDVTGMSTPVIDAQTLGDNMIIYAENQTFLMSFLGDAAAPFKVQPLFLDSGIIAQGAIAEFEGNHFVVGRNDIYVHNGATRTSIAENRIRDSFFADISTDYIERTRCVYNPSKKEIWVCYPAQDSVSGELTKMLIWNHIDNVWSTAEMPTSNHVALIEANIVAVGGAAVPPTWDGSTYVAGRSYAVSDVIAYPSPTDWYTGSFATEIESTGIISAIVGDVLSIELAATDGVIVGDTITGVEDGGVSLVVAVDDVSITVNSGTGSNFTIDNHIRVSARYVPVTDVAFGAGVKFYKANTAISVAAAPPPSGEWDELLEHDPASVYTYLDRVLIPAISNNINYFEVYAPDISSTATLPAGEFDSSKWLLLTTTWTDLDSGNIETWEFSDTGSTISNTILSATSDGKFQLMDTGYSHDGAPYTSYAERNLSDYSEQGFTLQQVKYISRIYPQMEGTSTLYFALRGSMTAGDAINPVVRIPSYTEDQYKVDLRVSGRYISMRIQSVDTGFWKISGLDLEITDRGLR